MPASPERLFALAWRLEEHGQYNNAKLLRAAAEALTRRAASRYQLTKDHDSLAAMLAQTAEQLQSITLTKTLGEMLAAGAQAMAENRLPLNDTTPDVAVCRSCGEIEFEATGTYCVNCGYHNATRKRFLPVYWLNHFDPLTALDRLKSTPVEIERLMNGRAESELTSSPDNKEWSFRKTLSHIVDAQELLAFRLDLLLEQDEPVLESQAVFLFEEKQTGRPPTTQTVFAGYVASRQVVIETLEGLPLREWWRKGFHQEFGWVTIGQQASYFAAHELTHFQQIRQFLAEK